MEDQISAIEPTPACLVMSKLMLIHILAAHPPRWARHSECTRCTQQLQQEGWLDMNMRRARAEDAPALARVHVDSWRAAYHGLVSDSYLQGFTYQCKEESFRQSLATDAEETYLVEVDEEVVGFLTLGAGRDSDLDVNRTGEIWGIYISPDYWRRGIGKRLAGEAERILKSRGYEDAVLWVLEGNQQARQFYETMGFSLDGNSKNINWGRTLRAVRYRKALELVGQNNRRERCGNNVEYHASAAERAYHGLKSG